MTIIRRSARLVANLGAVTRAYLASPGFRRAAMQALSAPSTPLELSAATLAEAQRAPDDARPYAGTSGAALALSVIRRGAPSPRVRLVLSDFDPERVFAGVATALTVASGLSRRAAMPLEIIVLSEAVGGDRRPKLADAARSRTGLDRVEITMRGDLLEALSHPDDVWIVTHWTTAHPAMVATRAGVLVADRVVYLIQDYEPGFFALSSDSVTARSTYHAGFVPLINSTPVASVLRQEEGLLINPRSMFGPDLDLDRLERVRSSRVADRGERTVFFYGRPSKPRNLFPLGVAALRIAARDLPGERIRFVSAGEPHRSIELGGGHRLEGAGTLDWDAYFALLAEADVVLSLQASPHPSHPPLEAALAGAVAVTNEVAGTRAGLHPRLIAVEADPLALGRAVVSALRTPATASRQSVDLGGSLDSSLDAVISQLALGGAPAAG